jgi:DNA-binding response OmpR family regulator
LLRRSKTDEGQAIPADGAHLLVVDDDPGACETVRRFFELHRFEVTTAADIDAALAAVTEGATDLVVIDFHQGGTTQGLKLLDRIRAHDDVGVAHTRVIMTTDLDENRVFSWQSGVDGFLIRPYHANELIESVVAALGRTDAERAAYRQDQMRDVDQTRRAENA